MELTVNKTNNGRIVESVRDVKTLNVYVGSRSVKTNNRRGGKATMRLVLADSHFATVEVRTALQANLETGKFYQIQAIVDEKTRRDMSRTTEVREVLSVAEIEPFPFEKLAITYVRPEAAAELN